MCLILSPEHGCGWLSQLESTRRELFALREFKQRREEIEREVLDLQVRLIVTDWCAAGRFVVSLVLWFFGSLVLWFFGFLVLRRNAGVFVSV